MQTFLPYPSFQKSAEVLDDKRLGKQRVECLQILKALTEEEYGWKNHPAVKMWEGYGGALALYGDAICDEWIRRGFQDTCKEKLDVQFFDYAVKHGYSWHNPPWLGDEEFHQSHQSNLLRKKPEHYRKYFKDISDNLNYVWPQ